MARVLIVGCGCRGRELAGQLRAAGHSVRGTTRQPAKLGAIEAAGAEAVIADPDRVATVVPAFAGVAVVCLLLGSATGAPDDLRALHTTRLEMLLARTIDTPIRGVVYEATGTIDPDALKAGARIVGTKCDESMIPHRILLSPGEAKRAIEELLNPHG